MLVSMIVHMTSVGLVPANMPMSGGIEKKA